MVEWDYYHKYNDVGFRNVNKGDSMDIYKQYKKLKIDKSYLGLEPGDTNGGYFCTPEHCHVIGWAGVDGIHYGFVEKFGEMVFAINPMPIGERCVYPLAENFEVFLQLILAGKGVNSIEQIEHFSPEQFAEYLKTDCVDDPAHLEKQQVALDALQTAFHLEPHPNPYGYVKALQADFDYEAIPYSDEYYDVTGLENPHATLML